MRHKEIIAGMAIAALLLAGFIFRGKIFHPTRETPPEILDGTPQSEQPATSSATSSAQTKTPPPSRNPQKITYHGRPLDEVRLDAESMQSMTAQQKDRISQDIKKYAKVVKETPDYGAAWLQLAILKKGIGDYAGARDIWVYLTVVRPHEITAFLNLGDLYTNYLKDYPKAEQNLRVAIRREPKNEMAYISLSDLYRYFYKGKEPQAEIVLKQGIAANPNSGNLPRALASLYERRAK